MSPSAQPGPVVVLAGGTGGAKLARGMLDVVGGEQLVVIANTGDDVELYGAYVSPDPDLITFWLADRIDERGWGLARDTFNAMEQLRELREQIWFNLGDRDLAIGLHRARALAAGRRLTDAHAEIVSALDIAARVLPMSDQPVRTRVRSDGASLGLQEFLIQRTGGAVDDVEFRGARAARPTPEILEAIGAARAIVIGPSNPVISIGPILSIPGLREALCESAAAVVAVSPLVGGEVLKGPTAAFMSFTGEPLTSTGIARLYGDLIDGLVADQPTDLVPILQTDVLLDNPASRARVARVTLEFALSLGGADSVRE